jgi:hypothetical protein
MSGLTHRSRPALSTLAIEIRREVEQAEADFQSAIAHAVRAGELLIEAKGQLKHGEWLPWLAANFPGSARSAQGYMRLAEHAEDAQRVAHLGIKGALKQLAAPKRLDAVDEIERLLQDASETMVADFAGAEPLIQDGRKLTDERLTWAESVLEGDDVEAVARVVRESTRIQRAWARFSLDCERALGRCLNDLATWPARGMLDALHVKEVSVGSLLAVGRRELRVAYQAGIHKTLGYATWGDYIRAEIAPRLGAAQSFPADARSFLFAEMISAGEPTGEAAA